MQSPELPALRIEYTLSGAPDQDALADHNSAHSLPSPDYTRAVSNISLNLISVDGNCMTPVSCSSST